MAFAINGNIILKGFGQLLNMRVENTAADPVSPQEGSFWLNTTDKVFRGYVDGKVVDIAVGGNVQQVLTKLSAVINAVGLNADGSFSSPAGANYIASATSVIDAVTKIDAALKTDADALAAEITRATAAENLVSDNLAAEITRATAAENQLTGDLTAEITRAEAAEKLVSDNLAAEITRATGVESGLDTRVAAVETSYVKKDGSVAFTGDQSVGGNKLTTLADPVADGDAANKKYVDNKVGSLGNAFNYVSTVTGGADEANAFDMSTLPNGGKDTGDYYKVAVAGYFKGNAAATPFKAEKNDGLVKNVDVDGWDVIAHADTVVYGVTNEVAVSGTIDTGFTVGIDAAFSGRVVTLESGLAAEITRAEAAEAAALKAATDEATRATAAENLVSDNLAAEITRAQTAEAAALKAATDEVTRATAAEGNIQTELDAAETAVGLTSAGALPTLTGTYIASATSVLDAVQKLDTAAAGIAAAAGASSFLYEAGAAATSHVVTHNLGQKYVNYTITDSDDNVIGVDGVHFDSANQLTVTLLSAQTIRVFVKK